MLGNDSVSCHDELGILDERIADETVRVVWQLEAGLDPPDRPLFTAHHATGTDGL
jgi:hypothetical protein